ncbi:hypothetical protein A5784_32530 [Mycobacterium sp. 852013-50091_SCH5140682]|uniref:pyridoxamine 5'-phosphate oxidase family protein n=1 Tax=Mycobacterium sp. 852013-50091_SCH5140682 TaxID=1834109 RepID=UPI0007EA8800|nr:pyridoxamine 5'-phosphate oxidase family protein [Mycobacterium sp. 852013-50091_SCH5140682]OBC13073.1 hypothetical protein A5784_32530 [Mycobacterium sp. 852013-50091_SCH5140682]
MVVQWPAAIDEVLDGDQVIGVATVTPARGVVISPMTNFAVHRAQAGVIAVNSSLGAAKKTERMRRNPHVAVAFHSRHHSSASGSQYVLVHGDATVSAPVLDFPATIGARWDDKDGAPARGLWGWWLRDYYVRVPIAIAVRRLIVWPGLDAAGAPEVYGEPLPEAPASQSPPSHGTAARTNCARAARISRRLPHVLLGWVGADGYPVVVPVSVDEGDHGLRLSTAAPLLPAGERRAGLTAHQFTHHGRGRHGDRQRLYTGWLEGESPCTANYYPHSGAGFAMPPSTLAYRMAVGLAARKGAKAVALRPDDS